jgi:hypothetical protein
MAKVRRKPSGDGGAAAIAGGAGGLVGARHRRQPAAPTNAKVTTAPAPKSIRRLTVKLDRDKLDRSRIIFECEPVFLTQLRGSKDGSSSERRCIRFSLLAFPKA